MNNKIIAVICVVLMLAAVLAACGKKPTIRAKDGKEYLLVTDAEGNTVVDGNGNLVVQVTDTDGKNVTDENGENKTAILTFPEAISRNGSVETASYILTAPEGWSLESNGTKLRKKVGKATIDIADLGNLPEGETLESYAKEQMLVVAALAEEAKTEYSGTVSSMEAAQFSGREAQLMKLCIKGDSGVFQNSEMLYFLYNNHLFKVLYSADAEGYEETFDFMAELQTHLQMK